MPGKRYTEQEKEKIVLLKKSGKSFEEIKSAVNMEFGIDRPIRALKIIYDRHQADYNLESEPETTSDSGFSPIQ